MAIYTRDIAADIVELFELVLDKYNIKVPSPEDDEREPDNDAKLYGTEYYNLIDAVEWTLLDVINCVKKGDDVEAFVFSGIGWQ